MVIVLVQLEMLGEGANPFGEKRDLHFGRARIMFVELVLFDDRLLVFFRQSHRRFLLTTRSIAMAAGGPDNAPPAGFWTAAHYHKPGRCNRVRVGSDAARSW